MTCVFACQSYTLRTNPLEPRTHGAGVRVHRPLNTLIVKVTSQTLRLWDVHLPYILAAYRASESESTGFTPNRLFLGRELCMPVDIILGDSLISPELLSPDDYVAVQLNRMQTDFTVAREFMQRQATTRANRYDLKVKPRVFAPGDLVYYFYPRRRSGLKDKWSRWYTGPYQVMEQLSSVLYKIQKNPRSQPKIVYVDKLKKVVGGEENFERSLPAPSGFEPADLPFDLESVDSSFQLGNRPKRRIVKPVRFR